MGPGRHQAAPVVDLEPGGVRLRGVLERVGDGAVVSLVLVRGRDLDDGTAGVGHLHDVGLVDFALELRGIVVDVGYLSEGKEFLFIKIEIAATSYYNNKCAV